MERGLEPTPFVRHITGGNESRTQKTPLKQKCPQGELGRGFIV